MVFNSIWWGSLLACEHVSGLATDSGRLVGCSSSGSIITFDPFDSFSRRFARTSTVTRTARAVLRFQVRVQQSGSTFAMGTYTMTLLMYANAEAENVDHPVIE